MNIIWQFLHGSHKAGRIDHVPVGEHVGADPERLAHIKTVCPLQYCELKPGDAMFFHSNVLHYSAQNSSDRRRWGFLIAYNRADNNPVKKHHHPFYTPLNKASILIFTAQAEAKFWSFSMAYPFLLLVSIY